MHNPYGYLQPMICVECYIENNIIVHNINGRCDRCGGTEFEDQEVLDKELDE